MLLGYYDQTFDVMRRCYQTLDRPQADPGCPIRTWDDAVAPSNLVGVVDAHDGTWEPWVASFSPVAGRPGSRGGQAGRTGTVGSPQLAMADLVVRSLRLLIDFFASASGSWHRCERLRRVQHLAGSAHCARRGRGDLGGSRGAGGGSAGLDAPLELGRACHGTSHHVDGHP